MRSTLTTPTTRSSSSLPLAGALVVCFAGACKAEVASDGTGDDAVGQPADAVARVPDAATLAPDALAEGSYLCDGIPPLSQPYVDGTLIANFAAQNNPCGNAGDVFVGVHQTADGKLVHYLWQANVDAPGGRRPIYNCEHEVPSRSNGAMPASDVPRFTVPGGPGGDVPLYHPTLGWQPDWMLDATAQRRVYRDQDIMCRLYLPSGEYNDNPVKVVVIDGELRYQVFRDGAYDPPGWNNYLRNLRDFCFENPERT